MNVLRRAQEMLEYDPASGNLIWKVKRGKADIGQIAGALNGEGYMNVTIDGKTYLAHRICWLLFYREWPKSCIDHINRTRSDNRICNLRQSDPTKNQLNRTVGKNNSSGVVGVQVRPSGRWHARIQKDGKVINLGTYDTFSAAMKARADAQMKYALPEPAKGGEHA